MITVGEILKKAIKNTIYIALISIFFIYIGMAIASHSNSNYDKSKIIKPTRCGYNSALLICDTYGNCMPSDPSGVTTINGYDITPCQNITKPNPKYINNCCVGGLCLKDNNDLFDTYTINNKTINLTECDKIPKIIISNKTTCNY